MKQVTRILQENKHCVTIMGSEVGSEITDRDVYEASQSNSVIMGFDVECTSSFK